MRSLFLSLLAAALLSACASTHDLQPSLQPRDADGYAIARSLAGAHLSEAAFPRQDWWTTLGDAQLDALIAEALQGGPSLGAADARLRKAQAQAGLADAARQPSLGGSGQYALAHLPEGMAGEEFGGRLLRNPVLMVQFKWPLDAWGGKRAEVEAALDAVHAAQVEAQAARLGLAANIAHAYIALAQAFDAQDLAARERQRSERLRALGQQRVDAGLDNQLSLRNADAAIAAAGAQAEAAQQQIDALRNAIAALLGQGPDRGLAIARPQLLDAPAPSLPGTLPSELLGHRPDVVAARWRVEAAGRGIASAQAKFKPGIDLSAMAGLVSAGFSDLFRSDSLFGVGGPAISLPIFDGGALRHDLAANNADYDLAVASYEQAVVDALREAVDALQAIRSLDAQTASLVDARVAAASAMKLAETRHRAGLGTQLDVLNLQRPLLQIEQQLAGLRAQRYAASVDLDHALGGGIEFDAPTVSVSPNASGKQDFAKTPTP